MGAYSRPKRERLYATIIILIIVVIIIDVRIQPIPDRAGYLSRRSIRYFTSFSRRNLELVSLVGNRRRPIAL